MNGFYKMSIQGLSHKSKDIPCQDFSDAIYLNNGWVVAAVADGVGSKPFAKEGSEIAVKIAISFIQDNIYNEIWNNEMNKSLLMVAFAKALNEINNIAKMNNRDINDYGTTLDIAIYDGLRVAFGHSGDGGIIALSNYGEYSLLTKPQKGDAFNVVIPLQAGPDYWTFGFSNNTVCSLLLLTDGLYDVICPPFLDNKEYSETPIYIKEARRYMDINELEIKSIEDMIILEQMIKSELSNNAGKIKKITDDITVVGIINLDIIPEKKDYKEPNWEKIREDYISYFSSETTQKQKSNLFINASTTIPAMTDTILTEKPNVVSANINHLNMLA